MANTSSHYNGQTYPHNYSQTPSTNLKTSMPTLPKQKVKTRPKQLSTRSASKSGINNHTRTTKSSDLAAMASPPKEGSRLAERDSHPNDTRSLGVTAAARHAHSHGNKGVHHNRDTMPASSTHATTTVTPMTRRQEKRSLLSTSSSIPSPSSIPSSTAAETPPQPTAHSLKRAAVVLKKFGPSLPPLESNNNVHVAPPAATMAERTALAIAARTAEIDDARIKNREEAGLVARKKIIEKKILRAEKARKEAQKGGWFLERGGDGGLGWVS